MTMDVGTAEMGPGLTVLQQEGSRRCNDPLPAPVVVRERRLTW